MQHFGQILSHLLTVFLICESSTQRQSDEKFSWPNQAALAADGSVSLKWRIHDGNFTCRITAATTGWVGFGLSPNGAMKNSDLVILGVKDSGEPYITDMHSGDGYFVRPDHRQDYQLLEYEEADGKTIVSFTRRLRADCQPGLEHEDRAITDDTQHVLYAYSDRDPGDLAAPQRHQHRGQKTIHLTDPAAPLPELDTGDEQRQHQLVTWSATQQSAQLPNASTVYWCRVLRGPPLTTLHHAISYRPVITPGNEAVVHHMVLYQCAGRDFSALGAEAARAGGYQCYSANMPPAAALCRGIVAGWGVGGGQFRFPADVGFPLGPGAGDRHYIIEVHYDLGALPAHARQVTDSSGLQFTLTTALRRYESSMLTIGSDVSHLQIVPPGQKHFTHVGHCSDECLDMTVPAAGVTVFAALPHTHLLGHQIRVRHFRGGREVAPLLRDDNYDFNYQQLRHVRQTKLYPGDQLSVECVYDSRRRAHATVGGLSTREEMCVVFLQYYPAMSLVQCVSWPQRQPVLDLLGIAASSRSGRYSLRVSRPAQFAGMSLQQYLDQLSWSDSRRARLQQLLANGTHTPECYDFGRRVLSTSRNTTGYPAGSGGAHGWLRRPRCAVPSAAPVAMATSPTTLLISVLPWTVSLLLRRRI